MLLRNKIALIVVGAGLALTSAYLVATSDAVVGRLLHGQLAKLLKAPCSFEGASFSFLSGIDVRGLVLLDPAAPLAEPIVSAASGHVNYSLDLLGVGPHVTGIHIRGARVRVERGADGAFAFRNVIREPTGGSKAPPFPVEISEAEVTYADPSLLTGEPLALHDGKILFTPIDPRSLDWRRAALDVTAVSDVLGPVLLHAVADDPDAPVEVRLELPKVAVDPSVPRRFKGELAARIAEASATGEIGARVVARFARDGAITAEADVTFQGVGFTIAIPEAREGEPAPKPVQISGLAGRLRYDPAKDRIELTDLAFQVLGGSVGASGIVESARAGPRTIAAHANVAGLEVTRETRAFLPWVARRIAEAYDLTGTVGADAEITGDLASPSVKVKAGIENGHVRYEGYPDADGVRHGFAWDAQDVSGSVSLEGETIRIEATARHGPASVHATGSVVQAPGRHGVPDVTIVATNVPLDDDIRSAFGPRAVVSFDPWKPSGLAARVVVHVLNDPAVDGDHDVTDVSLDFDGRASFLPAVFPEPVSGVTGKVEILNPAVHGVREELVRITNLSAKADAMTLRVNGTVQGDGPNARQDLQINADADDASAGFKRGLEGSSKVPRGAQDASRKLGASGPLALSAHLLTRADGSDATTVLIGLKGASFRGWDDIPLAVRNATGRVYVAGDELTLDEIAGELAMEPTQPKFTARGKLTGLSTKIEPTVRIEAQELLLGDPLRSALGPLAKPAERFWTDLSPAGGAHADVVLDLRPSTDATPFEMSLAHIQGALRPLGLDLDNSDGSFHFDGRTAEIRGLESAVGAAMLRFDEVTYDMETKKLDVRAAVRGLHFPEDLEGPLSAATIAAVVEKMPGRTLHAPDVHLVYDPQTRTVSVEGTLSVRPRSRRPLPDPGYAPVGTIAMDRLVFAFPDGGPSTFEGEGRADDFALRAGLSVDRLFGPLAFSGEFGTPWKLDLRTERVKFRLEGYPFDRATAHLVTRTRGAHVDLDATFMGGDVKGWVGPSRSGAGFQGKFELKGADLESFLRLNSDPQKEVATGRVDGDLEFVNETGVRADLRGGGSMSIHDGRLTPAPGIGDFILRAMTLGISRFISPSLTDAKMKFGLEGEWILVREVEVTGPAGPNIVISAGEGRVGFDGTLDVLLKPRPVLIGIPLIDPAWILATALPTSYRVSGTLRNPRISWDPLATGAAERGREPQPAGDVSAPEHEPW